MSAIETETAVDLIPKDLEFEENLTDSGKIIYDWNPPLGEREEYKYRGDPITKEEVYRSR